MDCEDKLERVDIGKREQEANMEGIIFCIDVISKVTLYCEECQMESEEGCRINHPQKLFLYYNDLKKCLDRLKDGASK